MVFVVFFSFTILMKTLIFKRVCNLRVTLRDLIFTYICISFLHQEDEEDLFPVNI